MFDIDETVHSTVAALMYAEYLPSVSDELIVYGPMSNSIDQSFFLNVDDHLHNSVVNPVLISRVYSSINKSTFCA